MAIGGLLNSNRTVTGLLPGVLVAKTFRISRFLALGSLSGVESEEDGVTFNADVTLRLDPKTLDYALDTSGVNGSALFARGTLDLGGAQSLVTDQPRLQYVFRATGAAFADTVVLRGGRVPLVVRVDPWSGVARADAQ